MPAPLRILMVEDSADDAELILLELSRGGPAPDWRRVETAAEMRAALADGTWDVVLSDNSMPGFGAARALVLCREADPMLPFVVVSGTIGEHKAVEMMRAGAADYLLKGHLTRLPAAVEREVREAGNRRARLRGEQSASLLAAVVASSDDAILSKSLDGAITSWNPGAERLYGWTAAEAVGRHVAFLVPPDRAEELARITARLGRGERVPSFETVRLRKGGTRVEVAVSASHLQDRDGRLIGYSWIVRDVGDRKRAEEVVRASEARLRAVVESDMLATFFWQDGGGVTEANDAFLAIVGYARGDLLAGRVSWVAMTPPECRARDLEAVAEIARTGRCAPYEKVYVREDGRRVPILLGAASLVGGGGVAFAIDLTKRKQAEARQARDEERYRALVAATTAIVWDSPASGAFDSDQPGWTKFTGQTVEQHRGWGWLDAVHPDDREKSARAWGEAVAGRSEYRVEHRLRRADGVYRQMAVLAFPTLGPGGSIQEWIGVHTDVTERQRADSDRRELLDRLNLQIERMPLAYMLTGTDSRYTRWNPAAERIFGFAEAEVLGRHPFDVVVPLQARPLVGEIFDRLKGGDMNAHGASENLTRDGRAITCEWYYTPLFDAAGTFTGVLSLAQDVTERKRLEEQFRAAERRLHHVVASSPVVLFTLAVAGDQIRGIDWIGENLLDVLGHRPEAALGPDWWRANIHPDDRDRVAAQTDAGLSGHGRATHEYRFRHGDGGYRWTRGELRLIRDPAGRPAEVVGSWSDITERKSLEEQFRQAQKMEAFGQLAGGVAHDFNNLLTIINGYSDMVLGSLPAGDPNRELVGEIHKAGERSAGLTRQLLAFSRQQVLAPRVLDLNAVVGDTASMLRRLIGEDVTLSTASVKGLWPVKADLGQAEQILLNLAVNARDAMPTGGTLTIETRNVDLDEGYAASRPDARPGPHVLLAVSDTGCGMTPAVRAKIFEPFFTTKAPGQGTGLGLATVYGIVRQSGGHVEVASAIGAGTTFNVYLPRTEQAAAGSKSHAALRLPPRGTETVLVVEDDAVRALTRRVLRQAGYTVLEAGDGDEGLRVAGGHPGALHLLVTDVVMPGLGGRATAERLAGLHPGLRVLFVSGYTDDAVVRHGVLHDEANFLQKPFSPAALAWKVREVLDAPVR